MMKELKFHLMHDSSTDKRIKNVTGYLIRFMKKNIKNEKY